MGREAGASMRKDVDNGWPGLLQRFLVEAEGGEASSANDHHSGRP